MRWQKPGDEALTNVPAMVYTNYPQFSSREAFYNNSEILIEKGDHIRLQDITLSYEFTKGNWHTLPFNRLQFYIYANNLGILWRANELGIDPDDPRNYPAVKNISFGIRAEL
jgi:hypothetical protein